MSEVGSSDPDRSDTTLVVVPTYNERESLPRLLDMLQELDTRSQGLGDVHVLVVDDGSPDGTGQVAEDFSARHPGTIHVLHRPEKTGLGPAYVAGFRWGLERGYARLCEMDADLSHPPERLSDFIEAARDADFVIGSRYVNGRVTVVNWPVGRLLISLFGSFYARLITGLPVSDATGGYNLFRSEVLASIDLDRIESSGYAFQIELKYRAWRRDFRFREIPIVFTERDFGESKMSGAIVREAIWKVWKLRFMDLFGKL